MSDRLMTAKEAAALFQCSEKTIYRWADQGVIPARAVVRLGRRLVRFEREGIRRLIDDGKQPEPEPRA